MDLWAEKYLNKDVKNNIVYPDGKGYSILVDKALVLNDFLAPTFHKTRKQTYPIAPPNNNKLDFKTHEEDLGFHMLNQKPRFPYKSNKPWDVFPVNRHRMNVVGDGSFYPETGLLNKGSDLLAYESGEFREWKNNLATAIERGPTATPGSAEYIWEEERNRKMGMLYNVSEPINGKITYRENRQVRPQALYVPPVSQPRRIAEARNTSETVSNILPAGDEVEDYGPVQGEVDGYGPVGNEIDDEGMDVEAGVPDIYGPVNNRGFDTSFGGEDQEDEQDDGQGTWTDNIGGMDENMQEEEEDDEEDGPRTYGQGRENPYDWSQPTNRTPAQSDSTPMEEGNSTLPDNAQVLQNIENQDAFLEIEQIKHDFKITTRKSTSVLQKQQAVIDKMDETNGITHATALQFTEKCTMLRDSYSAYANEQLNRVLNIQSEFTEQAYIDMRTLMDELIAKYESQLLFLAAITVSFSSKPVHIEPKRGSTDPHLRIPAPNLYNNQPIKEEKTYLFPNPGPNAMQTSNVFNNGAETAAIRNYRTIGLDTPNPLPSKSKIKQEKKTPKGLIPWGNTDHGLGESKMDTDDGLAEGKTHGDTQPPYDHGYGGHVTPVSYTAPQFETKKVKEYMMVDDDKVEAGNADGIMQIWGSTKPAILKPLVEKVEEKKENKQLTAIKIKQENALKAGKTEDVEYMQNAINRIQNRQNDPIQPIKLEPPGEPSVAKQIKAIRIKQERARQEGNTAAVDAMGTAIKILAQRNKRPEESRVVQREKKKRNDEFGNSEANTADVNETDMNQVAIQYIEETYNEIKEKQTKEHGLNELILNGVPIANNPEVDGIVFEGERLAHEFIPDPKDVYDLTENEPSVLTKTIKQEKAQAALAQVKPSATGRQTNRLNDYIENMHRNWMSKVDRLLREGNIQDALTTLKMDQQYMKNAIAAGNYTGGILPITEGEIIRLTSTHKL